MTFRQIWARIHKMLIFNTFFAQPINKMQKIFFRTVFEHFRDERQLANLRFCFSVCIYKYQVPLPYVAKPFAFLQGENPKPCGNEKQTK
jgi:hypothetical protein